MTDLAFVPSLLKPTFQGAGIKTVEALLSRDVAEFQARRGWGRRKMTVLRALQQLYRDAIRGSLLDRNSCVSEVVMSDLLPDLRLGQMTVDNFVNSSAEDWGFEGRRKEDFDGLKQLFAVKFNNISSMEGEEAEGLQHSRGSEQVEIDLNGVPENRSLLVESDLGFVPSLLKPTFDETGIRTVKDLSSRNITEFQVRVGWGERKTRLFVALQRLYRDCARPGSWLDLSSHIGSVVSSDLLPDSRLHEMTVGNFITSSGVPWVLGRWRKNDLGGLKRLLASALNNNPPVENGEIRDFFYLQDFEHIDMPWHYVPLNLSKGVTDLLARYRLVTLRQLDRLVVTSNVVSPDTGELLPALEQKNFGKTSLSILRNELEELGRYGLEEYRRRHGVVGGLEQLPDPDMDWRAVPLRLSKRIVGFLDEFEVGTLAEVYRLSAREEVFCPKGRKTLSALM